MAGEVGSVGKGFFKESGELKSKTELSKEEAAAKRQPAAAPAESPAADTSIFTAIGSVRSRFAEKANAIATVINQDEQNLKESAKAIRAQLTAAKDLKEALKNGDEETIEQARAKLNEATEQRNQLADKIKRDNAAVVADRAKNLSIGNEQLGITRTKPVELERSAKADINNVKDVNELIRGLRSDRESIANQRGELNSVKQELRSTLSETDARLSKLQDQSIRDIADAERTARDLASRIVANGSQALSASKISEQVARQLLQ